MNRARDDEKPPAAADERLWSVRECANYLNMSASWVYIQVRDGLLPSVKMGRRAVRFQPAAVRQFAERMASGASNVIPLRKKARG